MKQLEMMCKTYTQPFLCVRRRQGLCGECIKRDVIVMHYCDGCGSVLDKDNPMHEYEGQELCGECYDKKFLKEVS